MAAVKETTIYFFRSLPLELQTKVIFNCLNFLALNGHLMDIFFKILDDLSPVDLPAAREVCAQWKQTIDECILGNREVRRRRYLRCKFEADKNFLLNICTIIACFQSMFNWASCSPDCWMPSRSMI